MTRLDDLIEQAKVRCAEYDRIDRNNGTQTPQDIGPHEVLSTALAALRAGMNRQDWTCVADAYVLLTTIPKETNV